MLFGSCFMFSNVYRSASCNETCVAIANLCWSINKNQIECFVFVDFVLVIGSACWLKLNWIHRFSQLVCIVECGVVTRIWRCSLILFKHVSLWCLFFDLNHTPIKYRCPDKKNNWITPTYLKAQTIESLTNPPPILTLSKVWGSVK